MNPWFDARARAIPGALTDDFARIVPRCAADGACQGLPGAVA
jgi:hypothetical protein